MISQISENLWEKLSLIQSITKQDLLAVVKQIDVEQFWIDCQKFLTIENKFIKEENILLLKDDSHTLANMYRLFSIYYVTKLLVNLG